MDCNIESSLEEYLKESQTEHAASLLAGMHIAEPKIIEVCGVPHMIIPAGSKVEEFESLMERPTRLAVHRTFSDPESFCQYVNSFNAGKSARIYANHKERKFVAILDDHHPDMPSWCVHQATLSLDISPEWKEWYEAAAASKQRPLDQQELAEFFESNIRQIAEPDAAELLGGVRNIQMANNWKCVSAHREGGDIAFSMQRESSANTTIGNNTNAKLPARLTLSIFPFMFWNQYALKVMLTYRLKEEKIAFTMKLLEAKEILDQAVMDVCDAIEKGTEIKPLL